MIRVEALQKRYGDVHAVRGVSFAIERGEVVGFLGPNGAGKSTTMRCLAGTLFPDAGRVEIAGHAVRPERLASRRSVGYLPESTPLYPRMRVVEYLDFVGRLRGLGRRERREAIGRVVADCGLAGRERQRNEELSKGYRQRVGLAQALLSDPDVLILDEPTSGLDPGEVTRIRALVRDLGERKTVLLSTHVLGEVQETCRRVVIVAGGRVVADGSPMDLAADERAELVCVLEGVEPGPEVADAAKRLAALPAVASVRRRGRDDGGRLAFGLEADDRYQAAREVLALTASCGWTPVELRHELPSLEQVFLRRTAAAAADEAPGGEAAGAEAPDVGEEETGA